MPGEGALHLGETASRLAQRVLDAQAPSLLFPSYARVAGAVGLTSGAFLDVCCGAGWLAIHVASGHAELDAVAIDPCPDEVRRATRNRGARLNVTVREMAPADIVYPPGTFDAAGALLAARRWGDPAAVLASVHRVLGPGGRFYVYELDPATTAWDGWLAPSAVGPARGLSMAALRRLALRGDAWAALKDAARASAFVGREEGSHGPFRRLVLTRS